mmetsp:Transcript_26540/g.44505  ORF Transcript_26540/g.44505 Transcript_26540/m.44505 type:complete len:111 (+) Transcript_26540:199-531(+)
MKRRHCFRPNTLRYLSPPRLHLSRSTTTATSSSSSSSWNLAASLENALHTHILYILDEGFGLNIKKLVHKSSSNKNKTGKKKSAFSSSSSSSRDNHTIVYHNSSSSSSSK